MRALWCLLLLGAVIAAALPLLLEARLHDLGDQNALVVVEDAKHAQRDACSGGDCFRRVLEPEEQQTPQKAVVPEFVPTHEWQDILPDQAIPPGLYIRVNLETGRKEAKLLD